MLYIRITVIPLLFLLFYFFQQKSFGEEFTIDHYIKIKKFAFELMDNGEYYRAITEFYRVNCYFPDNIDYIKNLESISNCYYLSDNKLEAIEGYKKILKKDDMNWKAVFSISKIYNEIFYYHESNQFIESYLNRFYDFRHDSLFFLSAINNVYLRKYDKAKTQFEILRENTIFNKKAEFCYNNLIDQTPLKFKNKYYALCYSIIPGGGYFYTRRIQTGFSALITNCLFSFATYECFKKRETGLGTVCSVFSISFYLGSIYGSLQAVTNYNKNILIQFSKQFKF